MTDPQDPPAATFAPVWLSPADVKGWLTAHSQPYTEDDTSQIRRICAMAEPYVQRCRPEFWVLKDGDRVFEPDAEAYQGGVMYAAREFRRRNSPAGIEVLGDASTSFVTRYDTDIERALHTGAWAPPIIA